MAGVDSDLHRSQAERAHQLADQARQRTANARAAAERHERLGKTADAREGERHVRAAALQRDAEAIFERAAALMGAHADHELRVADALSTGGGATRARLTPLPAEPPGLIDRYLRVTRQQALAALRDQVADVGKATAGDRDEDIAAHERRLLGADPRHAAVCRRAQIARAEAADARREHRRLRQAQTLEREGAADEE